MRARYVGVLGLGLVLAFRRSLLHHNIQDDLIPSDEFFLSDQFYFKINNTFLGKFVYE